MTIETHSVEPAEDKSCKALWLEPGERLLWSDHPVLLRYLRYHLGNELWGVPVGLCVIVSFYFGTSSELFIFAALAIVAVLAFKPVKVIWDRSRTFYALTDRRAVIDIDVHSLSIPLRDARPIRVRKGKDGSGDIVFNEALVDAGESRRIREEGFIAIKNVANVERLLHESMEQAATQRERAS